MLTVAAAVGGAALALAARRTLSLGASASASADTPPLPASLPIDAVTVVVAAALAAVVARAVYLVFFHPLAGLPGPAVAKVSDVWKIAASGTMSYVTKLQALHKEHGDVVRIAPNEVSINAPDDIRQVYGYTSDFLKGPFYDAWSISGVPNHFSNRNAASHGERRKTINNVYSATYLQSLERRVERHIRDLVDQWDAIAAGSDPIDAARWMDFYTYDSVSDISFGQPYGFIKAGKDEHDTLAVFEEATAIVSTGACTSTWGWILPSHPMMLVQKYAKGDKGLPAFVEACNRFVKKRTELRDTNPEVYRDEENHDMLFRFLESKDSAGKPLDADRVTMECIGPVVAGADTTKIELVATLRYVYENPRVLAKLREEIDEAVGRGMSLPPDYSDSAGLKYLGAVLKEAMRLHPGVGMPLQRVVPAGGRVIGGRFYPEGTYVGMSAWITHFDERAYGKDAAEFRPERWLEGSRQDLEKYNLTFGMGTRVCLGKNVSLMSMGKLVPTIIARYDLDIVNKDRPYRNLESWFVNPRDFLVRLTPREA